MSARFLRRLVASTVQADEPTAPSLQAFVHQHLRGGGEVASASTQSARTLP